MGSAADPKQSLANDASCKWRARGGLHQLESLECIPLPNSKFNDVTLVLEIGHGGRIYTTEIGKCYKLELSHLLPELAAKN